MRINDPPFRLSRLSPVYRLILLFVLSPIMVIGQTPEDYGFQQIKDAPSRKIYDLMIDHKGFLWIGHELGISRYDGQSFVNYTNDKRSSMAMDNLIEDSSGRIWCKNFNGQVFYIEHGHMHLLQGHGLKVNIQRFDIVGEELIGKCNDGIFIYNLKTKQSKVVRTSPNGFSFHTLSKYIISNDEGKVFFLVKQDTTQFVFQYNQHHFSRFEPNLQNRYTHIVAAGQHHILLKNAHNNNLTRFLIKGNRLIQDQTIYLPGSRIYAISSKTRQDIWVHSPKKSILLNSDKAIHDLSLTDYEQDREGNIWASSLLYGLLIKKNPKNWTLLPIHKKRQYITSMTLWNGDIIAGTATGDLLMADTASFFQVHNKAKKIASQASFAKLFKAKSSLYAYGRPGILILDSRLKVVKRIQAPAALSYATHIENKFLVWASNVGMIALPVYSGKAHNKDGQASGIITRHFTYRHDYRAFVLLRAYKRVRGICYDSTTKTLYAGFSDGLFAYTKDSVREVRWKHDPVYAYDIKPYRGKLYIATLNKGVLLLQGGEITGRLHKGNDMSSSILKLKIQGNHLWVIGVDDIQLYDFKRKKFLSSISFPPIKGIAVEDLLELNGSVYLSTTEGIYQVPLSGNQKKVLPLNYLLYTVVNNSDTISEGAVLPYKKNSLQFNLAGLYYADPGGVYFRYRLLGSGADTNWKQTPPGQREILFPYVMPGHYTFEAAAYTATGLKAKDMLHFSFTIQKPWWQQWWFLFSIVAATGGIIYLLISMRMKAKKEAYRLTVARLEHESERLQYENVANESELKALKSQMNPHFIANALNTIQELFMKGERNMASEQLGNFATLTRMVLNVSGKKFIFLETEIDILEKYLALEKMRFREGFSYDIVIDEEIDEGYIQIPPMILQPFVENSVKHGLLHKRGDKYLKITFTATPDNEHLVCTITDNGVGRARATAIRRLMDKRHDSFSIEALKKRLDLMGKATGRGFIIEYTDMKDSEGTATGTSVRISIPIFTT